MSNYEKQEIAYAKEIMAKALKPVEAWEKKVRKNNAKFHRASPEEKRVILAKDVIAALDERRDIYVDPLGKHSRKCAKAGALANKPPVVCTLVAIKRRVRD